MRFLLTARAFETTHSKEDVRKLRENVGKGYGRIKESGKLVESGVFGDQRGGFFLVDVNTAAEIHEVLGPEFLDNFTIEAHPIAAWDELGKYLDKITREGR